MAANFLDGRRRRARADRARHLHDEFRSGAPFRIHADAPAVRLQNLINDRQAQSRAAHKTGLQRLEYPGRLRGVDPDAGVADRMRTQVSSASRLTESTPPSGMARSALLQRFQKTCLSASRSARARRLRTLKSRSMRNLPCAVASRSSSNKRFFNQWHHVHVRERVGLLPRIIQKVA